ncbi:MAG: alpha-ketoglutarate-dependent dioxygenase AlkB [Myxococcota bacterium]
MHPPVPSIPGVLYVESFLADADQMFTWALANAPWDDRIRARKTASFGVPYDYAGLDYAESPFPPELDAVRVAVGARVGMSPNNCLLNYYPDGRSRMGFHSDSAMGLVPGSGVGIVSLGAARKLRFRRTAQPDERLDYLLEPGSLLFMAVEVQSEWQHAVPRNSRPLPRISLTFRAVAGR